MDLKWEADEDGGAAAPTLIATGPSRIPEAMPTRLPGHELKASEPGAEMAVLLYKQDHTWLVESMEQGGAATADIERSNKVGSDPSQPGGRETDWRAVRRRRANKWSRHARGDGLWWSAGRNGRGRRGRGLCPHIVMPDRCRGVPKMTWCADADHMNTEGTMHMEGNLMYGRSGSYLQSTAPLGPIGGLLTELLG